MYHIKKLKCSLFKYDDFMIGSTVCLQSDCNDKGVIKGRNIYCGMRKVKHGIKSAEEGCGMADKLQNVLTFFSTSCIC